jgi:phosphatidylglycerol---prolipoprotein diacylglyceryl transferase
MQPLFLFKLLGVPFFSFTTLAGLGILLALLAAASAYGSGLEGRTALNASAWVSAGALMGGRLVHIAYNFAYFSEHPARLLYVDDGGMAFVGLFCGGCLGLWLWCRRHQVAFSAAADCAALPVSVLAALAWLGAFLHGSQYGAPVDNALALELRDTFGVIEARWPTQLLAAGWSALVGLVLIARQRSICERMSIETRRGAAGVFLVVYGTGLFLLDFTRGDASVYGAGLRLTQILYLIWGLAGIYRIGRSLTPA